MSLRHDDGWTIPFDSPYYPSLPTHYRDVRFQYVFFEADRAAVARLLPDPLRPSADGLAVAMGIAIPFSTAYGAFNEAALELKCTFGDQVGWYCSHVWHDGPAGIAAGREIWGTPKIFSQITIEMVGPSMLTRAAMGGIPVLTLSTTLDERIDPADLPDVSPSWRLKLIPRADRPGPAVKQLIDASPATLDLVVQAAYRGRGTLHIQSAALCDLSDLKPRAMPETFYMEASYAETFGRIAYDYLSPEAVG